MRCNKISKSLKIVTNGDTEMTTTQKLKDLWIESGNWEGKHFVQLFGETRGRDLWRKFDANNVLGFLCKECRDEEIEALLNFKRT